MQPAEMDRASLRESIIAASIEIATEHGEEGLTMRGLAARLGLSPTALYQHFEGKAAILQEIRVRGLSQLLELAVSALELPTTSEVMRETSRRYIMFARENAWLYRLLFQGDRPPEMELNEEQLARVRRNQQRLAEGDKERFARLALQGDDVLPQFLMSWWCSLHGVCSLLLGRHMTPDNPIVPVPDTDKFIERYIDDLVEALLHRIGE
jgi:AcrR family transcriptional regulator